MKKVFIYAGLIFTSFILITAIVVICIFCSVGYGDTYETNSIGDYRKIAGNFDNETPSSFIESFFPEKIDNNFSDVSYHYKAKKGDTYAYECYLEFTIKDPTAYDDFIERHIDKENCSLFAYDETYQEKSISNVFLLGRQEKGKANPISNAQIGKILFSEEQQKIIFIAIGMYDGGGANTTELGYFFSRFQIDPIEYEKNAYATNYYQEKNIPNSIR